MRPREKLKCLGQSVRGQTYRKSACPGQESWHSVKSVSGKQVPCESFPKKQGDFHEHRTRQEAEVQWRRITERESARASEGEGVERETHMEMFKRSVLGQAWGSCYVARRSKPWGQGRLSLNHHVPGQGDAAGTEKIFGHQKFGVSPHQDFQDSRSRKVTTHRFLNFSIKNKP